MLASSVDESGAPNDSTLDSGIKLPPGAEIFPVEVTLLHPTQLAVGMQQVCWLVCCVSDLRVIERKAGSRRLSPVADVFPVEVTLPTHAHTNAHPDAHTYTQTHTTWTQVQAKMGKVQKKAAKGPEALDTWLRKNPVPVVLGPGQVM